MMRPAAKKRGRRSFLETRCVLFSRPNEAGAYADSTREIAGNLSLSNLITVLFPATAFCCMTNPCRFVSLCGHMTRKAKRGRRCVPSSYSNCQSRSLTCCRKDSIINNWLSGNNCWHMEASSMPYTTKGPYCSASVRSPRPFSASRRVSCPECDRGFKPEISEPEDDEADEPASRKSTSRKRQLVDDDHPRTRRPSRNERDDSIEDTRPKVHRTENRADHDRPRRRRKSKKSGARRPIRIVVLLVLVIGLGIGGVLLYPKLFKAKRPQSDVPVADLLAWIPSDAEYVLFVDADKFRGAEMRGDMQSQMLQVPEYGVRADEYSVCLRAGRGSYRSVPDISVLQLYQDIDQERVISACGGQEAQVDGKKYYRTSTAGAVTSPGRGTMVTGRKEQNVVNLLRRPAGQGPSAELKAGCERGKGAMLGLQ